MYKQGQGVHRYASEILDELNSMWCILSYSKTIKGAMSLGRAHCLSTAIPRRMRVRDTHERKIMHDSICVPREAKADEEGFPFTTKDGESVKITFDWFPIQ